MIEVKKSIEIGQPLGLYDILKQLQEVNAGLAGQVYFVDSNTGSDTQDGLSWDTAFATLAYAIAYHSARRTGYGRNTIFCRGKFTETLTAAPEKCDLIGVGATSARSQPRITGTQAFGDTAYGTRFINLNFRGDAAATVVAFTAGGFEIHGCVFSHPGTHTATYGLTIVNPTDVLIKGCKFEMRNEAFFSSAAISLTSSSPPNRCHIIDCDIKGAVGVVAGVGHDDNFFECSIENCNIFSSGVCVNDQTGGQALRLINNRMITQAAESLTGMNVLLASGNIYTSTTDTRTFPFATVSA